MRLFTAASLVLLVPGLLLGQNAPASQPGLEDRVIPELKFENITLDDAFGFLRDTIPGLNITVIRTEGTQADQVLPPMNLKNVTLGQFLDVVRSSFSGVEISKIDGSGNPVFVVRITQPAPTAFGGFPGGGFAPGGMEAGMGMPVPAPQPVNLVRVYMLESAVAPLVNDQVDEKQAMTHVLSLMEAALQQLDTDNKAVMRLHEPTHTVVFKGNPEQVNIIEEILRTLTPAPDAKATEVRRAADEAKRRLEMMEVRYNAELDDARKQLDVARQRLSEIQKELEKSRIENAVLTTQLDQLKAAKSAAQ